MEKFNEQLDDKPLFDAFENQPLGDICDVKQGLATADNNRFLRLWFEVDHDNIGFGLSADEQKNADLKWYPYNKGGKFRKWYGNQEYVVNWKNDGIDLRNFQKSVLRNSSFYFKESISWSKVTIGSIAFRYFPKGFLFDVAGCSIFIDKNKDYIMSFLNSKISEEILNNISPTINFEVSQISNLPIIKNNSFDREIII